MHLIKPGLERISRLLDHIGSPHTKTDYIIVGGTNGKGSVSAITARILELNGYKTGLYTSPHLVSITERIKIDNNEITYEDLDHILGFVLNTCEEIVLELSYFELLTAAAFIYFSERQVDIGVLEVGMGGRWDATNVVNPLISVIINVSMDHMAFLGNSISKITSEKVEIIKQNGYVVTSCSDEALDILEKKCFETSAKSFVYGRDFSAAYNDLKHLNYKGLYWDFKDIKLSLKGIYQINNAALAICNAEILNKYFNYNIDESTVAKTLNNIKLAARMEITDSKTPIIMDGGHNPDAAKKIIESLDYYYPGKKFVFLISMLKSKNLNDFIKIIINKCEKIIYTQLIDETRSYKISEFQNIMETYDCYYETFTDPLEAYRRLKSFNKPSIVCGSLYLIGYLKEKEKNEETCDIH